MESCSIVMPYFNRKAQLIATLKSMALSKYHEFDVTVIDDASEEDQRIEELASFIKLIRVEPQEKKWVEPFALINKCIRETESEYIILQNAECYHHGDIISSTVSYLKALSDKSIALSFACFALNEEGSKRVQAGYVEQYPFFGIEYMRGWYNHSKHNPRGLWFCCAFRKEFYLKIGGFDEEYAQGLSCADDDLVDRIKKYGRMIFIDNPLVLHQWHSSEWQDPLQDKGLRWKNHELLAEKRRQREQLHSSK